MLRNQAYSILSDLIFRGFITVDATIGDKKIILKTVNNKEFNMIKYRSGYEKGKNYLSLFNSYFLAYSIFMIDGNNILIDRESAINDFREFFASIPNKLYKKIMDEINIMKDKVYDATNFLEGFIYTNSSRWLWRTMINKSPCSSEFTGIPGTSSLGVNSHQENWVIVNKSIDHEMEYNKDFDLAILVASASSPKGAKQIRSKHDNSVQTLEEKRKKLAKIGYIDTTKWSPEGWASSVDTAEDLVSELERQMAGIKDRHDLFMENYMNSLKEKAELQAREAEEKLRSYRDSNKPMITGSHRILSLKETEELFKTKKSTVIPVESEETVNEISKNRYLSKIGSKVLTGRK